MFKKIWKYKAVRVIIYFHLMVVLISAVGFTFLLSKNNREYKAAMLRQPFDAVIVPGVPFRDGTWSAIMQLRVYWAKYLYDQGIAKHIIFSGSAVYSPYIESEIMRAYAIELGLPDSVLFAETAAEHSAENMHYSLILAREKGFKSVALASDPFQTYMLTFFGESQNLDVAFLPAQHRIMKDIVMESPKVNFELARVSNFVSLPDRESLFTRLRGTMGLQIDPDKREQNQ